jgi:C2 domain
MCILHFYCKINFVFSRLGYHSSGGFYFEYAQPLSEDKIKIIAPAYKFNFSAQKLDRKDGPLARSGMSSCQHGSFFFCFSYFGHLDPFFIIKKTYAGYTEPSCLYRSEVVKQSLNPTWNPISLNTASLGVDEPFCIFLFCLITIYLTDVGIEVFDWDKDGIHELIGKFTTTLREFTFGNVQFGLKNPEKEGR